MRPSQTAELLLGSRSPVLESEAREAFGPSGWTVRRAADADEVLAICASQPPTLALLSFQGPNADSIELCRRLTREHGVPVLLACDDPSAQVVQVARRAGAATVLRRPLCWPLVVDHVHRLLDSALLAREIWRSHSALHAIQRIARIGTWTLQPDTGRMRWSDQMYELLGLEADVATDFEGFSLCIHPDDRDSTLAELRSVLETRERLSLLHRIIRTNGSVRHVELKAEVAEDDPNLLRGTLQDVTEQRRAQEKIRNLAHFDSLTGLANRRYFMDQLDRALERHAGEDRLMALLYMDLDHFKRINDTLGHTAGDELLRHVGDLLFDRVRSTDVVGRGTDEESEVSRLGGDEFAVLLTEIKSRDDAALVASRILASLPTPILVDGHEITTTSSIGIAVYPEDGEDVETLVKHADRALYHAKEKGRNSYAFFTNELNAGAMKRLTMEARLRAALENGDFSLRYQPRLDLKTGRVCGVEALLRWTDAELGRVPPKEFVPLAEETGLIVPLGTWVLRTACEQAVRWREMGHDLHLAVNVSTVQFRRGNLPGWVAEALRETTFDPQRLELEITESLVLQDDEATATLMRELRAMGIRIALDDFGTGYSSLSYLARFPLDILKLDRSLVRDVVSNPHAQGVATAVISMAHTLGLRVVAEGVDGNAQEELLRRQGCDEMQGFVFAGPLEPEDVAAFVATRNADEDDDSAPLLALRA